MKLSKLIVSAGTVMTTGSLFCGTSSAGDFNYPDAESLARKTVIESFVQMTVQPTFIGGGSVVRNRLSLPIASISITNVRVGKFSDRELERWADYNVELEVRNSKGEGLKCLGIVNVEKSNVLLGSWHTNEASEDLLDCLAVE